MRRPPHSSAHERGEPVEARPRRTTERVAVEVDERASRRRRTRRGIAPSGSARVEGGGLGRQSRDGRVSGRHGRAPRWGRRSRRRATRARRRGSRGHRPARTSRPRTSRLAPGHGSVRASISAAPRTPTACSASSSRRSPRPAARRCRGRCRRAHGRRRRRTPRGWLEMRRCAVGIVAMDVERRDPSLSGQRGTRDERRRRATSVNGVWARTSTPASSASRVIPSPSTCATTGSPRSRALATTAASVAASKTGPESAFSATLMTDAPNVACSSTAVAAPPRTPGLVEGSLTSRTISSGAHDRDAG